METFWQWLTAVLVGVGSFFSLVAALGVFRKPDVFTRMQVSSKAATLGVSCALLAVATHFHDLGVTTRAVLTIAFLYLTAPVAAHMLGRSAYHIGEPFSEETLLDEWDGRLGDQAPPPDRRTETSG